MSGFASGSHQPAASQASAPPSALDIVHAQGVNTWESLLSPVAETTSTALPDDSELGNSPNFLLGVPTFSSELEATSAAADSLSWDSALFSASRLRPSALAVSDVHTVVLTSSALGSQLHNPHSPRPTSLHSL